MSEEQDDPRVANQEPSRRTFLKVSAVAGATVAAIAAGASMIPKMAASGAAAVKTTSAGKKTEIEAQAMGSSVSSSEPLILVVRGEQVDVYRGENKFPIKDSFLARDLASRVAAKIEV
jgi:anti-sigma factor RsiW